MESVPGLSRMVARFLSSSVLNLSTLCCVGAGIEVGFLSIIGRWLNIRGPRTKKEAFLMDWILLGTDLLLLNFGLTVIPVLGFLVIRSPVLGTIPMIIL